MNVITRSLLFLSLVLGSFGVSAQQPKNIYQTDNIDTKTNHPNTWQSYLENETIRIEYKFADCDPSKGLDNESVLLRITNLSQNKVEISWLHELSYDGVCRTCEYEEEYTYSFALGAGEILEGECEYTSDKRLRIFSKFIDAAYSKGEHLSSFRLGDLTLNVH